MKLEAIKKSIAQSEALLAAKRAELSGVEYELAYNKTVVAVYEKIKEAPGSKGMTKRDLNNYLRAFRSLSDSRKDELLHTLEDAGLIKLAEFENISGRGRKRLAWLATEKEA